MVFEKIVAMLAEQLGADESDITMDTNIAKDLGADSLDAVEVIMALEDEFDIAISDEASQDIKTGGDIVRHIEELRK